MKTLLILVLFIVDRSLANQFGRIVGGANAPAGQYPYQISLQVRASSLPTTIVQRIQWLHNCGGSIVTRWNIVTAAHCTIGWPVDYLSAWAGTNQLNGTGIRMRIASYLVHPHYVKLNTSDIAILTTSSRFVYSEGKIQPIRFTDEYIEGNVDVVLTGWGSVTQKRTGRSPNDLQRLSMRTITNDECNSDGISVDQTGICTLSAYEKGACAGDSGGPLVRDNGRILVGIVSYGTGMCGIGIPDVYTRVSVFAAWIRDHTRNQ